MANITYRQEAFASRERGAAYLRRVTGAFRLGLRNFTVDLDRTRRELRIEAKGPLDARDHWILRLGETQRSSPTSSQCRRSAR